MKTKTLKQNKVNVITLGCSKNIFDSEVIMGQLKANNFEVEHESTKDDAGIVIINTCGFIDNAKQESVDTILNAAEAKKAGLLDKLYVTGCLSERYKEDLIKEIPEVDAFFGTRDVPALLKTLNADYKHELVGERLLTTPRHFAYFKIAEGCDRPCSFCAIPLMRGKHVSTPIEKLIESAKKLVADGTKELILIAQDLTYYGLDIYKERKLAELLRQLSDIDGLDWIRLQYAYPSGFPMDVIEVMKERKNICNYLDMPLQHISDNMLKSMRRGITKAKTNKLVEDIRNILPDIALRTSLIVGYPGETEEDFQELCDWIQEVKFERLGVFTYSHEENTHAHLLEDDVPADVKQERAATIMDIQQDISFELNQNKIGKSFNCLFDRVEGEYFVGRTEFDSPEVDNEVLLPTEGNYVRLGDYAEVTVLEAEDYDLHVKLKE
jgi:ribosomal protein S12 methylthiotransferase